MTTKTPTEKDPGTARAVWTVALVGAAFTVGAGFVGGFTLTRSVALGAVIATANLWVIGWVVGGMFGDKRGRVPWPLIAVLKMGVLFGGLYLLLKTGWVELLPVMIGYGALPIGVVIRQFGAPRAVGEET
ncbi:MAG: ATP synthase subunit I [Myxococcales bacterium]|nr:ATP synthase subunit I [Myxococcales bacterium]